MKRTGLFFLSSVIAASAFSGLIFVACKAAPPLGQTVSPQPGPAQGGSTAQTTEPDPGSGAGGVTTTTFVLPDADVHPVDALQADASSVPASGDANCGSTQSKLEKKPVDLLLVLDRSSSMTWGMDSSRTCNPTSTTCSQRWETMISSLGEVLSDSPDEVYWGLKFFTSPTAAGGGRSRSCTVNPGVDVPIAEGNADTIQTQISTVGTANSTPTRTAIEYAVEYLKTVDDGNDKFILLATDGEPNCAPGANSTGGSDLEGTTTAVEDAAAAGYKVFVLGVGTEVSNLTGLAQAGGTEKFYSATTPEELSDALTTIVGVVAAGCTYDLPSKPAAPNAVGVFVDKALIPQSDSDGWSYAPGSDTTININGSYCDALKAGEKTQVEIFLPCEVDDPIPAVIL